MQALRISQERRRRTSGNERVGMAAQMARVALIVSAMALALSILGLFLPIG